MNERICIIIRLSGCSGYGVAGTLQSLIEILYPIFLNKVGSQFFLNKGGYHFWDFFKKYISHVLLYYYFSQHCPESP